MGEDAERIVFAGGGTGGHLFPALAVADELRRRNPAREIRFIGGKRGLERRLVPEAGYPLRTLRMSGLKGMGPLGKLTGATAAALAIVRCLGWFIAARPGLVVGVGGYASGPAVLAAWILRTKTMVLEQNHYPGATNRWLSRRVDLVCLPSDEARRRLGGIGRVTGNPVRREFLEVAAPALERPTEILVFGGSRGAHSINQAMIAALPALARLSPAPRVVHQTGPTDEASVREAAGAYPHGRYEVHAFLSDMPARFATADLIVARAGATTMAELAAAGRGSILVPYPFAADDHQRHNAEAVARAGAGTVVLDSELSAGALAEAIVRLSDDPRRLGEMGQAARALAHPEATSAIADAAESLLAGSGS